MAYHITEVASYSQALIRAHCALGEFPSGGSALVRVKGPGDEANHRGSSSSDGVGGVC